MTETAPTPITPDPVDQYARTVGQDTDGPIRVIHVDDARSIIDGVAKGAGAAVERIERELGEISARLTEALDDLVNWGAFDYLLEDIAQGYGVTEEEAEALTPIGIVVHLMDLAHARGARGDALQPLPEAMP